MSCLPADILFIPPPIALYGPSEDFADKKSDKAA